MQLPRVKRECVRAVSGNTRDPECNISATNIVKPSTFSSPTRLFQDGTG
jgi:hypothetical protein